MRSLRWRLGSCGGDMTAEMGAAARFWVADIHRLVNFAFSRSKVNYISLTLKNVSSLNKIFKKIVIETNSFSFQFYMKYLLKS